MSKPFSAFYGLNFNLSYLIRFFLDFTGFFLLFRLVFIGENKLDKSLKFFHALSMRDRLTAVKYIIPENSCLNEIPASEGNAFAEAQTIEKSLNNQAGKFKQD